MNLIDPDDDFSAVNKALPIIALVPVVAAPVSVIDGDHLTDFQAAPGQGTTGPRYRISTPPFTEEQRNAMRPIPMRDGAYLIPRMPITDPVAVAYSRERRRKMLELTKAAFPDLRP